MIPKLSEICYIYIFSFASDDTLLILEEMPEFDSIMKTNKRYRVFYEKCINSFVSELIKLKSENINWEEFYNNANEIINYCSKRNKIKSFPAFGRNTYYFETCTDHTLNSRLARNNNTNAITILFHLCPSDLLECVIIAIAIQSDNIKLIDFTRSLRNFKFNPNAIDYSSAIKLAIDNEWHDMLDYLYNNGYIFPTRRDKMSADLYDWLCRKNYIPLSDHVVTSNINTLFSFLA